MTNDERLANLGKRLVVEPPFPMTDIYVGIEDRPSHAMESLWFRARGYSVFPS